MRGRRLARDACAREGLGVVRWVARDQARWPCRSPHARLCCVVADDHGPALAAPAWLAPSDLSAAGQNANAPQVAFDADGDATAVWNRYDGSNLIAQTALRSAGGAWQAPVDLSAAGQDALTPQLAVDPNDNAIAVWVRSSGATKVIQAAVRPAGGSWQPAIDLSAPGATAQDPSVAVDANGTAVAIWDRSNGTNRIVQAALRPAGGVVAGPGRPFAPRPGRHGLAGDGGPTRRRGGGVVPIRRHQHDRAGGCAPTSWRVASPDRPLQRRPERHRSKSGPWPAG